MFLLVVESTDPVNGDESDDDPNLDLFLEEDASVQGFLLLFCQLHFGVVILQSLILHLLMNTNKVLVESTNGWNIDQSIIIFIILYFSRFAMMIDFSFFL